MNLRSRVLTGALAALIGTVSLCAQPAKRGKGQRRLQVMTSVLNLTPEQAGQARSIFQQAGQSARPVKMQLRATRKDLRTAIQAGDTQQIQQLASAEGSEHGQLAAIRATSMSKLYKILTPEQQQKMGEFQAAMKSAKKRQGVAN